MCADGFRSKPSTVSPRSRGAQDEGFGEVAGAAGDQPAGLRHAPLPARAARGREVPRAGAVRARAGANPSWRGDARRGSTSARRVRNPGSVEKPLAGAVPLRQGGLMVSSAVPDGVGPGSGEDSDGVWVAAGPGAAVDVGRPRRCPRAHGGSRPCRAPSAVWVIVRRAVSRPWWSIQERPAVTRWAPSGASTGDHRNPQIREWPVRALQRQQGRRRPKPPIPGGDYRTRTSGRETAPRLLEDRGRFGVGRMRQRPTASGAGCRVPRIRRPTPSLPRPPACLLVEGLGTGPVRRRRAPLRRALAVTRKPGAGDAKKGRGLLVESSPLFVGWRCVWGWSGVPAVSYSPTTCRSQYHRRWRA